MIYAETQRLHLRALEKHDLPRVTELIGDWDVTRWLLVVPYPYHFRDSEEFFHAQSEHYAAAKPEFFAIADKASDRIMGGIGLHAPRGYSRPGELVVGYWLGKPHWRQGFMSEAAQAAIDLAFERPETRLIVATTDANNEASQKVLRKIGLKYLGVFPRIDPSLRGSANMTSWEMSRSDYETARRNS